MTDNLEPPMVIIVAEKERRVGWWGLKPEVSANRRCKGVGRLSSKHSGTLTSGHTYINHEVVPSVDGTLIF